MENPEQVFIVTVNDADILSGRGGKTNKHPGNCIYRRIVKENRKRYKQMKSNSHKQLMAESIILCVCNRGGRFLKRHEKDQNTWIELSKEEAMIKTTQALREIPFGTSSRAFNVERMLEQKRKQKDFTSINPSASTSSSDSEDRKMAADNNNEALAPTAGRGSIVISHDDALRPADVCDHGVLSDEELESIVNDSDALETIVSLLNK
jgi:hypothetical protein